ncbi:MAG: hypothetical protein ACR2PQ_00080 [Myxococcota bacterium]
MSAPLRERLATLGRTLAQREQEHSAGLAEAWEHAHALREVVAEGLEGFETAIREAAAPQLAVELGPVRTDEKHVRSVEFEVMRGRHRALVIVKSRGEVTLVGPFRTGKAEGPCQSVAWDDRAEVLATLAPFLERFLEEAATP